MSAIRASLPVRTAPLVFACGAGLAAALCAGSVLFQPLRLEPATPAWRRLVRGADATGRLGARVSLLLPGVPRRDTVSLLLELESPGGGAAHLDVAIDGGKVETLRSAPGQPMLIALPPTGTSGARVDLRSDDGGPLVLRRVTAPPVGARPWATVGLAALVAGLIAAVLARGLGPLALALALWTGPLLALAVAPPMLWLSLPAAPALGRLLLPSAVALLACGIAWSGGPAARRVFVRGAALIAAFTFGAWVRVLFLPAAGSWDTEYWKTWTLRAEAQGVTRVYGDPEPLDLGRRLRQARGQEELWKAPRGGRDYVVDYPPLAMLAWRASLGAVRLLAPRLDAAEAETVAVKLPPVLGDVGCVALLLLALRDTPGRALALAALYWALPVSWLSSAVLGFLDAALAPLAAASLVAAGRGRAFRSGLFLALAGLFKPTAVLVAPAAALALAARGASTARAVLSGLAVVALALVPFALAGTLSGALVQMYRIVFQERLSGGFPNPWWFLGHALTVARTGVTAWFEPVRFVRVDSFSTLARPLGAILFLAVAVFIAWRQRGRAGVGPALLAGAALFFAYGMLAVGVHENHPHPLYLMLFATGLLSRRLRWLTAAASAVYVLNMLALSGLGRVYGPRYAALEPVFRAASGLRMVLGMDLTLVLGVVNLALFAWMLSGLGHELAALADPPSPAATP